MPGPNLVVIGAPKAATTALSHTLRGHDAVFGPEVKQPHFYAYLAAEASAAGHRERVDRERVLAHLYDDLCADPDAVVRALRFLDLDEYLEAVGGRDMAGWRA